METNQKASRLFAVHAERRRRRSLLRWWWWTRRATRLAIHDARGLCREVQPQSWRRDSGPAASSSLLGLQTRERTRRRCRAVCAQQR
jgi:uncharacterized protein YaeQ